MTKKRRAKKKAAKRDSDLDLLDDLVGEAAGPTSCGTATQEVRSVAANSIEFSRDAKGQPRWSMKLYGERDEMGQVLDEVLALDSRLREETGGGD